jgi:transcriptional regulator with XRE-family HTH domain
MGPKETASKKLLGKRVEAAVFAAGYSSPDEFARGIGLPRSTFFKLRQGTLDPRFSTILKIAKGLGLSLSALAGDSKEHNEPSDFSPQSLKHPPKKQKIKVTFTVSTDEPPEWLKMAIEQAEIGSRRSAKKHQKAQRKPLTNKA